MNAKERIDLAVYHALKIVEGLIYLGSFSLFRAPEWAAKWIFSRE